MPALLADTKSQAVSDSRQNLQPNHESKQAERDCWLFEREFWRGKENRSGSFDDILRILTDMRIESARAALRAASHYPVKQRVGLSYSSSASYPSQAKMKLVVADNFKHDDEETEECWA
jgi:hypothetical protein